MLEAADELSLTTAFSNSAASVSTPTSYNEYMTNAAAAASAAGFTKPIGRTPSNSQNKGTKTPLGVIAILDQSKMPYCWSHGSNRSHEGSKCTNRHQNHDPSATFINQRGGKKDIWHMGQSLGP